MKNKITIRLLTPYFCHSGGAFKTMPNSPRCVKPVGDDSQMNVDSDSSNNDVVPSVFTFNTVPTGSGKWLNNCYLYIPTTI